MKDVELLAQSIARDAIVACVFSITRKALEKRGVNSLASIEVARRMKDLEMTHINRALENVAANRRDFEMLLTMPPINPS